LSAIAASGGTPSQYTLASPAVAGSVESNTVPDADGNVMRGIGSPTATLASLASFAITGPAGFVVLSAAKDLIAGSTDLPLAIGTRSFASSAGLPRAR
jgi:hypothetical protein